MFNPKTIHCPPGLVIEPGFGCYERINTQPYHLHTSGVPDFHDLTEIPEALRMYEHLSDHPVATIHFQTFPFQNILNSAYRLLREDEFNAARIHLLIRPRNYGQRYVDTPWHSHNFSRHFGNEREQDRFFFVSSSNPTQIIRNRHLLVKTHLAEERGDHFYPDLDIPSSEILAAQPAQFLEVRENEAHRSPLETKSFRERIYRVLAVIHVPHQRPQIQIGN